MMTPLPKLNVMTLPWPTNWGARFGRQRPLILEIGFGKGHFLLHLARTYPDHNIVGLEISSRCLTEVEAKLERQHIENVRVVHAMAETALRHLFEPASLEQVHVHFPDPWFRTRHGHRRLMQRDTLDVIVSRLVQGGAFYLTTDILPYAEMSAALLAETPQLENQLATPWADALPGRVVTKYEAKARQEGRDCYYFSYRRSALPALDLPVIEESPMPHLVFSSPVALETIRQQFRPYQVEATDDVYIHYVRLWESDRHLLIETHVKEATIDQRVALVLSLRDDGSYTLQLSSLGHPRPTEGIHRAVKVLGEWLLHLHPDAQVIVRKVQEDDAG